MGFRPRFERYAVIDGREPEKVAGSGLRPCGTGIRLHNSLVDPSELADVFKQLPILQFLPPDVRDLVESSFVPAAYTFGQKIVRQGEPANALYVLVSGKVRVSKRAEAGEELSLGIVRPGETFGEGDLQNPGVLAVTVRASSDVEVLRLDQSVVQALIRGRPEIKQYLELGPGA